jgi:hypothetical protein
MTASHADREQQRAAKQRGEPSFHREASQKIAGTQRCECNPQSSTSLLHAPCKDVVLHKRGHLISQKVHRSPCTKATAPVHAWKAYIPAD